MKPPHIPIPLRPGPEATTVTNNNSNNTVNLKKVTTSIASKGRASAIHTTKKIGQTTKKIGHVAAQVVKKSTKKADFRWEELQRIEKRRRNILKRTEEPFWETMLHWDGTVVRQITKDSILWLTIFIYIGVRIGARVGLPEFVSSLSTGNITVVGGFVSFFLVFYVNQSHKRFFGLYKDSMACKGRIFDVATLARASLPPERAHRLVRYMNAAHAAGYVGLSSVYPARSYFDHINEQFQLLTVEEKSRMDHIDLDAGGSAYRELVVWSILEVQHAKAAGMLDREHATLLRDLILKFRGSMGQLYNAADLPIPFYYVHFICLLTAMYLPLFAITTGIKSGTGDEAFWVTDVVAGLIVVLQSIFVIGLRLLGQQLSDPYGDDLVDLSVMFYIQFTWTQSNRVLQSLGPPEPIARAETELELQRHRISIGGAWDAGTANGLRPSQKEEEANADRSSSAEVVADDIMMKEADNILKEQL